MQTMRPMRLALAASELTPFAKTGGLADVLLGLGRWLGQAATDDEPDHGPGHDVRLFVPFYRKIAECGVKVTDLPAAPGSGSDDLLLAVGLEVGMVGSSTVTVHRRGGGGHD